MTRRPIVADILVVGLLVGTAHCKPSPGKSSDIRQSAQGISQDTSASLSGTSWRLVKFQGGDGLTLKPDDKAKYTVAFGTDGRLNARIDCNRGRGGSLHDRMVKHWSYVRSYVIKDGHLFVSLMADGGIYEFEPISNEQRATTAPLENTYWKLTHLGDAPVTVPYRQPEPHLTLHSTRRRVTGLGACNRFTGSYELNGARLRFSPVSATLMACAEGMETEQAFLGTLGRVRGWRITGQQLELLDSAGNVVARFEARHLG